MNFKDRSNEILETSSNRGIIDSIALILLAFAIYFFLAKILIIDTTNSGFIAKKIWDFWNNIAKSVILSNYLALLCGMILQALWAVIIPAIVYVLFRVVGFRFPAVNKYASIVAYVAIAFLLFNLMSKISLPSPSDASSDVSWFRDIWNGLITWLEGFLYTCTMAIVFGSLFYSDGFGNKIAIGVLCLINIASFVFFGVLESLINAVPLVGNASNFLVSGLRLSFNFLVISDLLIITAISKIIKSIIEFVFRCFIGSTPSETRSDAQHQSLDMLPTSDSTITAAIGNRHYNARQNSNAWHYMKVFFLVLLFIAIIAVVAFFSYWYLDTKKNKSAFGGMNIRVVYTPNQPAKPFNEPPPVPPTSGS